jgi:hypothetical protein
MRDFFVLFCAVQMILLLLALLVRAVDDLIAFCVPSCQPDVHHGEQCVTCAPIKHIFFPQNMGEDHERIVYYLCAIVLFFACLGVAGLCSKCCEQAAPTTTTTHQDCCIIVDCKDPPGDNKPNDCAVVLIVIVVLIIVCFAFIGIFYGLILSTALFQRSVQRHMYLLELQGIAVSYSVVDLSAPVDTHIPYAQVINDVRELL